jgi:hypothetical protein
MIRNKNLLTPKVIEAKYTFPPLDIDCRSCFNYSLNVSGLLDTGSSVNVLPYDMGLALGAILENQS